MENGEKVNYKSLRIVTLKDFVEAYEDGGIQRFLSTSKNIMENYIAPDNDIMLYESYDIVRSSVQFIKKFINNADRSGKIGNIVYKAVDFMKQILVIKQMV
jgi:hypothetical protein